jgi:hypothetical protein
MSDRSDIPPTEDTYAGMRAARDGLPRVVPAIGLTVERIDEWLWGYDAWGSMTIFAACSQCGKYPCECDDC